MRTLVSTRWPGVWGALPTRWRSCVPPAAAASPRLYSRAGIRAAAVAGYRRHTGGAACVRPPKCQPMSDPLLHRFQQAAGSRQPASVSHAVRRPVRARPASSVSATSKKRCRTCAACNPRNRSRWAAALNQRCRYRLVRDQRRSSSPAAALGSSEKIESWALRRKTFQLFPEKSSALVQCARVPLQ